MSVLTSSISCSRPPLNARHVRPAIARGASVHVESLSPMSRSCTEADTGNPKPQLRRTQLPRDPEQESCLETHSTPSCRGGRGGAPKILLIWGWQWWWLFTGWRSRGRRELRLCAKKLMIATGSKQHASARPTLRGHLKPAKPPKSKGGIPSKLHQNCLH